MKKKTVFVVDYDRRIIWLDGEISPRVADKFQKTLSRLNKLRSTTIIFYIRGPGGDPYSAFTMMNDMGLSISPVVTVAHEYVRSACLTITQAGAVRLALKGTKFSFHPAVVTVKSGPITQEGVLGMLEGLRLIDSIQLMWFLKKARPAAEIFKLLIYDQTIGSIKAKKLRLIDDYYRESDFFQDKRAIRRILKAGS